MVFSVSVRSAVLFAALLIFLSVLTESSFAASSGGGIGEPPSHTRSERSTENRSVCRKSEMSEFAVVGKTVTSNGAVSYGMEPVSPQDSGRVNALIGSINKAAMGLVFPLAVFSLLISLGALLIGRSLSSGSVSRFGWSGLLLTIVALLLVWGMPVLIGLVRTSMASQAK